MSMKHSGASRIVLAAICLWLGAGALSATDHPGLVSVLPIAPTDLPEVVEAARLVRVDTALLVAGAEGLRLELPDGPIDHLVREAVERRGPGNLTWRGHVRFEPDSRVMLTLRNGFVTGFVRSGLGLYEIRPAATGDHLLLKLDTSRFAPCAGGRDADLATDSSTPMSDRRSLEEPVSPSGDPADQIHLMSLYTPQARDAAGGTAQIESLAQAAVDAANTAFADSGMTARFVLAHVGQSTYQDSGDMSADLDWLAGDAGVAALRDQHAADMVSLLVGSGTYCGIAFVMRDPGASFESSAFQVTHQLCAVGNLSFAHEHGHNMGFEHNPEDGAGSNQASYPYAFGHYVDGSFRTVMSYSSPCNLGCERVGRFSNPQATYNGHPTGVTGERDNAAVGEDTAPIVANFRASAVCGNGIVESGEECDGSDLGGASCTAVGCASGTPTCTTSCTLDYSSCSSCGTCDFDGLCEVGEDCNNCASDCVSGAGATCGNGICEAADGEDCVSCPSDCAGKTNGKPQTRFCCGDGDGPNPVSCSDPVCTQQGFQCTDSPAPASCCGDGSCTGIESGDNCSLDCGAPASCGDGVCDPGESSCSCALDCGSPPATELLLCGDGLDNDCDGFTDCDDSDCAEEPACSLTCEPSGALCSSDADCCSNQCRGKPGERTCR